MIVLVTGATAGFGLAIARRFAADGARIIAAGRRRERLEALAAELPGQVLPLVLDVTDRAAVAASIGGLPADWAAIDLLVNNAGLARGLAPAQEASLDDWEAMLDTNVKGVMYLTHAVLPGMVQRNAGHILNIGSTAAEWPYPGGNVYGATKAFVRQFSLNLRSDLIGTGVRVCSIEPGMVETEFTLVRTGSQEFSDKLYSGVNPMTAEDIAKTMLWVAEQPAHLNINSIELMPVNQAWSPFLVHRTE
jgi:3-hydroxy acid dehydrogenase / malonic semialdehyde reductase